MSVPILEKAPHGASAKRRKSFMRFGSRRALRAGRQVKIQKKDSAARKVSWAQWPVLNPASLFKCFIEAEAFSLLQGAQWDWSDFWERASHEEWGRDHPVLQLSVEERRCAMACSLHGDEGQGKRKRNVLVLSWSSLAVHGPSELTKFVFAAPWQNRLRSTLLGLRW